MQYEVFPLPVGLQAGGGGACTQTNKPRYPPENIFRLGGWGLCSYVNFGILDTMDPRGFKCWEEGVVSENANFGELDSAKSDPWGGSTWKQQGSCKNFNFGILDTVLIVDPCFFFTVILTSLSLLLIHVNCHVWPTLRALLPPPPSPRTIYNMSAHRPHRLARPFTIAVLYHRHRTIL